MLNVDALKREIDVSNKYETRSVNYIKKKKKIKESERVELYKELEKMKLINEKLFSTFFIFFFLSQFDTIRS